MTGLSAALLMRPHQLDFAEGIKLARLDASAFGGQRSIQLSYGCLAGLDIDANVASGKGVQRGSR